MYILSECLIIILFVFFRFGKGNWENGISSCFCPIHKRRAGNLGILFIRVTNAPDSFEFSNIFLATDLYNIYVNTKCTLERHVRLLFSFNYLYGILSQFVWVWVKYRHLLQAALDSLEINNWPTFLEIFPFNKMFKNYI